MGTGVLTMKKENHGGKASCPHTWGVALDAKYEKCYKCAAIRPNKK
jgi:hypothetical protein